ncbi:MAG: helix-turn-helix domain-containing protein, partial [Acidimicrobiales bacterium]
MGAGASLGNALVRRMEEQGVTLTALAQRVGASYGTVRRWARDLQSPRPAQLAALGRALDTDLQAFAAQGAGEAPASDGGASSRPRAARSRSGRRAVTQRSAPTTPPASAAPARASRAGTAAGSAPPARRPPSRRPAGLR